MNIRNYKQASDYKVIKWIEDSLSLNAYQKEKLFKDEIVRFAPFMFMEKRKPVKSVWWRLSVVFIPIVVSLLAICMPFVFFFTGKWGYGSKFLNWYDQWCSNTGI